MRRRQSDDEGDNPVVRGEIYNWMRGGAAPTFLGPTDPLTGKPWIEKEAARMPGLPGLPRIPGEIHMPQVRRRSRAKKSTTPKRKSSPKPKPKPKPKRKSSGDLPILSKATRLRLRERQKKRDDRPILSKATRLRLRERQAKRLNCPSSHPFVRPGFTKTYTRHYRPKCLKRRPSNRKSRGV